LLVGDETAPVSRVLVTLELTPSVVLEAVAGGYDTVVTHHPVLMKPLTRLVQSDARQRMLRDTISAGISVIACHTNLDSAGGGLADIAAEAIGMDRTVPLIMAPTSWLKLVTFVPPGQLQDVADAVFSSGAGVIGDYSGCAYALSGEGWFTPEGSAHPSIGSIGRTERVDEVRWETVIPRQRLDSAIRALVAAHPYEEPAFDIYPVQDVRPRLGLGRVGLLKSPILLDEVAGRLAEAFDLSNLQIVGDSERLVARVAVVPGSGASLLDEAAAAADVYISGDFKYHDGERAIEKGLSLISASHGELEWGAMLRWAEVLRRELASDEVLVSTSQTWRPLWRQLAPPSAKTSSAVTLWTDGGSRGNPGPSAIGIVIEDDEGRVRAEVGRCIGVATNNVAEYQALIEGLRLALELGAREVDVVSDSELLVKQMSGEYRVKNEGLKDLLTAAKDCASQFDRVGIRHSAREENVRADALVNKALDAAAGKKTGRRSGPASQDSQPGDLL
jgi:dinuclear metal center YbgI/SA1388 family protein